jgi:hypothetical protein
VLTSCAGSAGICRVRWLRRDRAGRTSRSTAEVKINSCATYGPPRKPAAILSGRMGRVSLLMKSVVPVWLVAALGAIAIAVYADPSAYLVLLPVVLGVTTLLTFGIQLGIRRKEGYVNRVTASATGAVVILGLATVILAPFAFAA